MLGMVQQISEQGFLLENKDKGSLWVPCDHRHDIILHRLVLSSLKKTVLYKVSQMMDSCPISSHTIQPIINIINMIK